MNSNQKLEVDQLNSLALAYMGDAVIDLHVRQHLLNIGLTKPHQLHRQASGYVSARAQAAVLYRMQQDGLFSATEEAVIRRGRNAKAGTTPKNTDVQTYRHATALEALFGFLFLKEEHERIEELIGYLIKICEEGRGKDE